MRDWKPGDIFEATCPWCNEGKVEFFKDEPRRKCPKCGRPVKKPTHRYGMPYAKECVGVQKYADKT
jgi:hypothetical protein